MKPFLHNSVLIWIISECPWPNPPSLPPCTFGPLLGVYFGLGTALPDLWNWSEQPCQIQQDCEFKVNSILHIFLIWTVFGSAIFTNLTPLGRVGYRVAMSVSLDVCVSVCEIGCSFFLRPLIGRQIIYSLKKTLFIFFFFGEKSRNSFFFNLKKSCNLAKKSRNFSKIVSFLLSAWVKKVGVSRMRDFFALC